MQEQEDELIEKLMKKVTLKFLLGCTPIFILILNLIYYTYWTGYFYYFNIHNSYLDWNNLNIASILFGIVMLIVWLLLNFLAFMSVVKKNSIGGAIGMNLIIIGLFVVFFSLEPDEVIMSMQLEDLLLFIKLYIMLFILMFSGGIFFGVISRIKECKSKKKENPKPVKKQKRFHISEVTIKIDKMANQFKTPLYITAMLITLLLSSLYSGTITAKQKSNFKVIDGKYVVIFENSTAFLTAKLETDKINTLIQKPMNKDGIQTKEKEFKGDFLIRFQ